MMRLIKIALTILLLFTSSWLFIACTQPETPEQSAVPQEEKPSANRSSIVTVVEGIDDPAVGRPVQRGGGPQTESDTNLRRTLSGDL